MRYFLLACLMLLTTAFTAAYAASTSARHIVLSESGEAKVMPTAGVLSFSHVLVVMLEQDKATLLTAEEARKVLVKKADSFTGKVKQHLKDVSSITKNFSANVAFSPYYHRDNSGNKIVGYQARVRYSIMVTDLSKAQRVTEAVLKSGVETVSPLYTQIDDAARISCEKRALKVAVQRGKERAEVMAMLMEGELSKIMSASIDTSSGGWRMFMAKASAEPEENMYEPQHATCSVRVEIVFHVK